MSSEAKLSYLPDGLSQQRLLPGDVLTKPQFSFKPEWFDAYAGPLGKETPLTGNILYVGVPDKNNPQETSHVMRLVSIDNPYFHQENLAQNQEGVTLFVMGGGSSDALTGLGMAANALDADNANPDGSFRIKNVVILSHPDSQPRNINYTDHVAPEADLSESARITLEALRIAQSADKLSLQNARKVLGHSMGAQMAIEMAQPLNANELILIEPTGIASFPKIAREFVVGSFFDLIKDALRDDHGPRGIATLPWRVVQKELQAMTGPYGRYKNVLDMIRSFIPSAMHHYQANREAMTLAKAFGIDHPFLSGLPNEQAINHDNTQTQRREFEGKVTLVEELRPQVANALTARKGFSPKALRDADRQISAVLKSKGLPPRSKEVLDETQIAGSNQLEQLYQKTALGDESLLTSLFPNAAQRRIIVDQGLTHRRMLDDATFYTRLFAELKSA